MPYNLLGRWVGGPYNSTVILEATSTGAHGKFKCPSGKWGSIKGIMMKGGARIKGTFVDPDASSSGTSSVDINLDSSGTSWSAHVNVDGRSSSWSGKKPEWRKAGGSQAVWYKNKASWERLLSVNVAKTKEWQEKQRAKLLEDSFDESGRRLRNALLCEAPALAVGEPYGGRNGASSPWRFSALAAGSPPHHSHHLQSPPRSYVCGRPCEVHEHEWVFLRAEAPGSGRCTAMHVPLLLLLPPLLALTERLLGLDSLERNTWTPPNAVAVRWPRNERRRRNSSVVPSSQPALVKFEKRTHGAQFSQLLWLVANVPLAVMCYRNPGYLTAVDKTTDPAVVQELLKEIAKSCVEVQAVVLCASFLSHPMCCV